MKTMCLGPLQKATKACARIPGLRAGIPLLICLLASTWLHAATISGTVKDPSGAVIVEARIEITGGDLTAPVALTTDGAGRFTSTDLKPGKYTVSVMKDGFEAKQETVELRDSIDIQISLVVAGQKVQVLVPGQAPANSDPVYRQLRDVELGESFRVKDMKLTWDAGTFQIQEGTLTWLSPVQGVATGVIFVGEGHFHLTPATPLYAEDLKRRTGSAEVDEDFNEVVFRFTREQRLAFLGGLHEHAETPAEAAAVLKRWRERVRKRQAFPVAFSEVMLEGETMDNVDADVLAAVYNPAHPPFLNAYIHGKKHKDLRFFVRTRVGALPQIDSPEEVGLINFDPDGMGMEDGVWYLAHLTSEYANKSASSSEERRLFATHSYKIETVIAKNGHLFSTATIRFEPLIAGERVLKLGLLPNLRVSRVVDEQGQALPFIQEGRNQDGSFYVVLPAAPPTGRESSITVDYAGDKVLESAGDGSFYVRARESWYPNLNGFHERALYDLTFKVPHRNRVISVGTLQSESVEQDLAISHWVTPVPVAVAGFNYGEYEKVELDDDITHYKIAGYYLTQLPNRLRGYPAVANMAPHAMTNYALEQARAQMQLCTHYFGNSPYDSISVTEQPDFNFGQSWPSLVYLPISAYLDSTERWLLFGRNSMSFTGFVQEVTPHEVAHQWWGHAVGWASYHDEWLSEGFAEFSAGLFLQKAMGGDWRKDYIDFWDRLRKRTLEKSRYGAAPNDAGPIWMGSRLISPRSPDGYQNVIYPKGAFVLEMLRSIMDHNGDDKEFIAMMHDFVESHGDRLASTESFKAIVDKHMDKSMDLGGNGRMDWFFNEWVYGTQIPKYHFEYQTTPDEGGKVKLHMTVTQSEVDEHFMMKVPVFADFGNGKGMVRIGQIAATGNNSRSVDTVLPSQPKKVALNAYKEVLER